MRTRLALCVLTCLVVLPACSLFGRPEPPMTPRPVYTIERAAETPALPGAWDQGAWAKANVVPVDRFYDPRGRASGHEPPTDAKVLYDDEAIYVEYRVRDDYVWCQKTKYQEGVSRDSCVEFFVQPKKDKGYFNFEMNATGVLLFHYREKNETDLGTESRTVTVSEALGDEVRVASTVEGPMAEPLSDVEEWRLAIRIPFALLEKFVGPLGPLPGQTWRANFYKCASLDARPHWAVWSSIVSKRFTFHHPPSFGQIRFAK